MKFFQIFILLFPIMLFSQNDIDNLPIVESELAKKILSQKINLNTINYDLKYHKLDLNLDPRTNSSLTGQYNFYIWNSNFK